MLQANALLGECISPEPTATAGFAAPTGFTDGVPGSGLALA